jgi:ATP-dependent Clp protease ATP-binding subunit ClpC
MMRFDRFTERAQDAAMRAYEILQRYNHTQVDTEHLLLALVEQPGGVISQILDKLGIAVDALKQRLEAVLRAAPRSAGFGSTTMPGQMFITPRLKHVMDTANEEANRLKDDYVSTEHLFLAIIAERGSPASRVLDEVGVTRERTMAVIEEVRGGQKVTTPQSESRYRTLERYTRDLSELAREGKLDPVIGRDKEILRVMQVLSRRTKNNPVLIGEAGVGKTAIVEGLAQKIMQDDVPEILMGKRVLALDLGGMVAGTRFRGEFEERLKASIEEIQRAQGEIILFIDELHTVVGAGAAVGAMDASNMLKPALARGELQCVGATTLDEYRRYIEKDAALERRFAPVFVDEPSVEETIQMLRGVRDRYEAHHKVRFSDEALVAAARLSKRYVTDRRLPDKAIDLVDEAASKLRMAIHSMPPDLKAKRSAIQKMATEEEAAWQGRDYEKAAVYRSDRLKMEEEFNTAREVWQREKNIDEVVDIQDIAEVVGTWTGIPVTALLETEAERLVRMEERLHERIVGQEEAIRAVSNAIRRGRSGLKDPRRPIGSFIFLGSSGVGKTELAKALAWFIFDDEDALVRVDMSEYRERHTVSRLIGAPPGYVGYEEGGQLTEAVRRRPYQVVLFDEIEKAHPEVWNALLQILEDGRVTDGQGHAVDFRNTVVIMTSNIGTQYAKRGGTLGFQVGEPKDSEEREAHAAIERGLRDTFRPEFLNRVDEIIIFHTLTLDQVKEIVGLQMREIRERLREQGLEVELTEEARDCLANEGYDQNFGARPLRRALQKHVENALALRLLSSEFKSGDTVVVDTANGGIRFRRKESAEIPSDSVVAEP